VKTHGRLAFLDHEHPEWVLSATPDVLIRVKRLFPRAATHARLEVAIRDTPEVARDLEWLLQRWPLEIARRRAPLDRAGRPRDPDRPAPAPRPRGGGTRAARLPARRRRPRIATGRLLLADDVGLGKR
jgi:hypothetical protein